MWRPALASSIALALAGCVKAAPATRAGECKLLEPAPYAVRADTRLGQAWVDGTIEAGVRVCGHARPPRSMTTGRAS